MKTKYYAVVNEDGSGPAFGIGTTPRHAELDAKNTPEAHAAVTAGNPDAWTR
jgi:hypothetical protein